MCTLHKITFFLAVFIDRKPTRFKFIFQINIEIVPFFMLPDLQFFYSHILGYLDLFGYSFYLYFSF